MVRNKLSKTLTLSALLIILTIFSTTPAIAETTSNNEVTSTATKNTSVKINSSSSFKVTVPSTITVNQSSKAVLNETYNLKVEGNISGTEKITVIPDPTFNITQSGKDNIPVTVTQTKTKFVYNEIAGEDGCNTPGKLTTNTEVTAGTWVGNLTFNIDFKEVVYTNFTLDSNNYSQAGISRTGNVVIPSTFEYDGTDYIIKAIQSEAFQNCQYLNNITIPNSITGIGQRAFSNCIRLESIKIPESITLMFPETFSGCKGLKSAILLNKGTLSASTFSGCTSLTSVSIGSDITSIGANAFYNCTSLNLVIPENITRIGENAFYNVPNVTITKEGYESMEYYPWGAKAINGIPVS